MFARFNENPAMTLQDIKKKKRYGRTDNVKTVYPPQTKFAGGIIIVNQVVAEKTLMKNVHMCYVGLTEGKIVILKKEGKMRISILIFIYIIHFTYPKVSQNFIISNHVVAEKTDEKCPYLCFIGVNEWKIENFKKEGKMRSSILIFINTIHFAYMKVYTKFHNPKSSSC